MLTQEKRATTIPARVREGKFRVELADGRLDIWLSEPRENGKANQQLIKELSHRIGTQVLILKGMHSRNKLIQVGISKDQLAEKLNHANQGTARRP